MRIWVLARALTRSQEAGKAYGPITAKALAVLGALLWRFANSKTSACFPSYEAIAEAAGCARSTVAEAIRMLEDAGILSWVQRIKRVREWVDGLFGKRSAWRWAVHRSSNSYSFNDPASKSDFKTRTTNPDSNKESFASNGPAGRPITDVADQIGPAPALSRAKLWRTSAAWSSADHQAAGAETW